MRYVPRLPNGRFASYKACRIMAMVELKADARMRWNSLRSIIATILAVFV